MKTKVLVYDRRGGYYKLLKNSVQADGFAFLRYNESYNADDWDVIVFFLQDKLEILDFVKLYDSNIPFVFGTPLLREPIVDDMPHDANIHYLDLNRHKEEISEDMQNLFSTHFTHK